MADLSPKEKLRESCDIKATNIILLGLTVDIYTLINHYQHEKEIWDRAKELMEFDRFTQDGVGLPQQLSKQRIFAKSTLINSEYHPYQPYLSHQKNTPLPQQQIIHSPPQQSYEPPVVPQQTPAPSTQLDSEFVIPSFLPTDDPIASFYKAIMFLSLVISSRFPPINNQPRTSSNPGTQATIQDGRVTVQNVQRRQPQGYAVNTGKSQATGTTTINTIGDANTNQPRAIRCYNCKGEDQQDFLADRLEEIDADCDDLQLYTTSNFKADHVDAYDSDCDDEANGNTVRPTYDSDILSDVPHYDTYHENDVLNSIVQETKYTNHLVSNNDSYDELRSDINVISCADYMVTIENDFAQYVPPLEQNNATILSVNEQTQSQVEKCNTVNQEAKYANEPLSSKLEQYKEKVKILEKKTKFQRIFNTKRRAFRSSNARNNC
nr:hypothetical protein [Tanacetum cinerariifolium]